jgi:phage gpG-like protein
MSQAVVTVIKLEDHFKEALAAASGETLAKAVLAAGHVVESHAKINASRGRPGLISRTGALVGSISTVLGKMLSHEAEASVGPTVIYGRIHELGGIIRPAKAKALRFQVDGHWVAARSVHIPARPYLRPAVDEHQDEILDAVRYQLEKALQFSKR